MFLGIKLEAWLTIIAIIIGPLLAFEVQRERDNRRERRNRRLDIYRRLMMTLKVPLAPSHVDALNLIPLEFDAMKDDGRNVLDAWRLYSSHLNNRQNADQHWVNKKFDLLVDLVYLIGQSLGYKNIDKATIRDNTYLPQGYVDVEQELHQIRKTWLEVLTGQRPITMTMLGPVQVEAPLNLVEEITLPEAPQPALPPAADPPNEQ
jgi:hypothetical protein